MGLPGTHILVGFILTFVGLTAVRFGGSCCKGGSLVFIVWVLLSTVISPLLFPLETREHEVHFVETKDNWKIALSRYRPVNSEVGARRQSEQAPVILCHGAFANRVTFDLGKGRPSLAVFLAEKGHDVWVLELRGHGRSEKPPWLETVLQQGLNEGGSWSIMKYIDQDLPAAVDYVKKHTQAKKVHWVGHSMGGVILYSWLALHMENAKDFASIVVLGSALDHSKPMKEAEKVKKGNTESTYHSLYVPRGLRSPGLAPFSWANHIFAPLGGTPLDLFLGFQYSRSSMTREYCRHLLAHNFESEPWLVLFEIHTIFSKQQGMKHPASGQPLLPSLNRSLPVPLLAIAGQCDWQFHPDAVERTAHHLAANDDSKHVKVMVAGNQSDVCYGHYDMLVGVRAPEHVFAPLEQWIKEVDDGDHWYSEAELKAVCEANPQPAWRRGKGDSKK